MAAAGSVLHCTAELMASSAVHGAGAERLGVLPNTAPSSRLGAPLIVSLANSTMALFTVKYGKSMTKIDYSNYRGTPQ